jgi:hypothetical protein
MALLNRRLLANRGGRESLPRGLINRSWICSEIPSLIMERE